MSEQSRVRRASWAMLCVGLSIFSGLYSPQALLPVLSAKLAMSSAEAAWTVSAATGALALCVIPASILSERFGRGRVLLWSTVGSSLLGVTLAFAPNAAVLIGLRAVQGVVLAGAPAVAMAWLAEELAPQQLPRAMGIYIAGNSIGGLAGRLITTAAVEPWGWRWALGLAGGFSLLSAAIAWVLLPTQRNFRPKELHFRSETASLLALWRNPRLVALYATAFLCMGTFVSMYNFIGFRLSHHFGLPLWLAGAVFLFYLSGTWSSAQAGRMVARFGRRRTLRLTAAAMALGLALVAGNLALTLTGLVLLTAAFFALHSTASGWVGALATHDRAEASSLYVFCYYLGSSVVGAATGAAFDLVPWWAFCAGLALLTAAILVISTSLSE